MSPRAVSAFVVPSLLLFCAPLAAQDPVAYWDFESGFSSAVNNGQFQGVAIGSGATISTGAGPQGSRALRLDDAAGANPQYTPALVTAQSGFTYTGTTSLGPIQGVPNNQFAGAGTVNAILTPATGGTFLTGQFNGGSLTTVPGTISANIPNPIPFLPPLATIDIINARFSLQSPTFSIGPGGAFTADLTMVPVSGMVVLTPLTGGQTTIDLSTAGPSNPTAVSGTIRDVNGTVELVVPINSTFSIASSGITATLTVQGQALAREAVHVAPPSYVDVANAVIGTGQSAYSIVAWYRHVDHAGNGSSVTNTIWETVDPTFVTTASSMRLQNQRAYTEWVCDDQAPGVLVGNDGTPVNTAWHHVALTWSRTSQVVRFYVDGALVSTTGTSGSPIEASSGFHIGASAQGTGVRAFDGYIDDVAVFDRELDGPYIAGLSNGTYQVMARPYGVGCQGMAASVAGAPRLGSTSFAVQLDGAPASAPTVLIFGDSNTTWPPFALPFDMNALGAPGCWLNASIVFNLASAANASGSASLALPIPNDTALAGATVYNQWTALAPGVNALGFVFSDGLEITVTR